MALARSPLAPARFPDLPAVAGVRLAACAAGLRYQGRPDLTLIELDPGTTVAGLFTRSLLPGHPVRWCRAILPLGRARALVVNAGQANVMVGPAGDAVCRTEAEAAAKLLGARPEEIYLASTGVIGERLDAAAVVARLPELQARLDAAAWELAARAISTTDTYFKGGFARAAIGDAEVTICGICKGSGMIQPDMATMLAFLFTDAAIEPRPLHELLAPAVDATFNAITIDGDTSTSDTLLLFATGTSRSRGAPHIGLPHDPRLAGFRAALTEVLLDLAHQVVKDGEGATKFLTVRVTGAESAGAARRIAFAIANSPLVKTAIAGEDPHWGRVVMAVGKAGEAADRDSVAIWLGDIQVAKEGEVAPSYSEALGAAYMKRDEIAITVDVGVGDGASTVWTCDLTADYIAINADYRS
jgi:glutamate N-acetyltransferase / amino-acid N-acetyltransferase